MIYPKLLKINHVITVAKILLCFPLSYRVYFVSWLPLMTTLVEMRALSLSIDKDQYQLLRNPTVHTMQKRDNCNSLSRSEHYDLIMCISLSKENSSYCQERRKSATKQKC